MQAPDLTIYLFDSVQRFDQNLPIRVLMKLVLFKRRLSWIPTKAENCSLFTILNDGIDTKSLLWIVRVTKMGEIRSVKFVSLL